MTDTNWKVERFNVAKTIVVTEPSGVTHELMKDDIVHPRAERLFDRLIEALNENRVAAPAVPQGALQVIDAKIASVKAANIGRGRLINSAVSFAIGLLEDVREAIEKSAAKEPGQKWWETKCKNCEGTGYTDPGVADNPDGDGRPPVVCNQCSGNGCGKN